MTDSMLHFLPVIVFAWFPLTFITSYSIAYGLDHIAPVFPAISDTGTFSPESCIFGQLINMGLILMLSVIYIRHRQVAYVFITHMDRACVCWLNHMCLVLGSLGTLGFSIVANFQLTNVISIHVIGASMAFVFGSFYIMIMTFISYKLYPFVSTKKVLIIRSALAVSVPLIFALSSITAIKANLNFKGTNRRKWSQKDGAFEIRLISTFSQWTVVMGFLTFFLTFYFEFKKINMWQPDMHIRQNETATQTTDFIFE